MRTVSADADKGISVNASHRMRENVVIAIAPKGSVSGKRRPGA
jgi:hypothetical protein